MKVRTFLKKSEYEQQEMDWGESTIINDPQSTDARHIVTIRASFNSGKGHGFHLHPRQEEVIYVLEGSIEQWVGEKREILEQGEAAFIPAGKVHGSFNTSDEEAKILAILSPAIGTTGYEVEEVGHMAPWNRLK